MKKTQTMRVSYIDKYVETNSRLLFVKFIKEYAREDDGETRIGLRESKYFTDSISQQHSDYKNINYFEILVPLDLNKTGAITTFKDIGVHIVFPSRENKLKRILYSDQKTLIEDMLMEKWEKFVDDKDLDTLTYTQCKEIAVKNIIKKYDEYIEVDFFETINKDIKRINKLESKDIGFKFMKFNEEFGEFNTEYIKLKGFSYKEYQKEELVSEMADTLQVLLSIYNEIGEETNISISDILDQISLKNKKWENKIKEYKNNN